MNNLVIDKMEKRNTRIHIVARMKYVNNSKLWNMLLIFLMPYLVFGGQYVRIGSITLANIFCLFLAVLGMKKFLQKSIFYMGEINMFFLAILIYAGISLAWTDYGNALSILLSMATGIMVMIYISSLSEKELIWMSISFYYFTLCIICIALLEIFVGCYFFVQNPDFTQRLNTFGLHYPLVLFINTNDLAQFLLLGLTILLINPCQQKVMNKIFILLTIGVIAQTVSRMCMLCSVIVMVGYWVLLENRRSKVKSLVFLSPVAIIGGGWFISNKWNYISFLVDRLGAFDFDASYVTGRVEIYMSLLKAFWDNLVFGRGLGTSYIASEIGPHNFFLFLLTDFGIVWAIVFVGILFSVFFSMYRNRKKSICGYYFNRAFLPFLCTFPFFSSVSSANEQRKTLWIALGFMVVVVKFNRTNKVRKNT